MHICVYVYVCVCVYIYAHIHPYIPKGGCGNPLHFCCLENPMDWSLPGSSPWGHKELDMTEYACITHTHTHTHKYTNIYILYTYNNEDTHYWYPPRHGFLLALFHLYPPPSYDITVLISIAID